MDPFEALAEPVRRRLIEILASGEHTSGQLADVVGFEFRISRTAVSKHLRLLRDAGYVDVRAEEKWRWYRLDRTGFAGCSARVSAGALPRPRHASSARSQRQAAHLRDPRDTGRHRSTPSAHRDRVLALRDGR